MARNIVGRAWDKSKKVLKVGVPMALGALPVPGAPFLAMGAGALMEGLDRPGKAGIGLDLGRAVGGAAKGYAAGAGGAALGGAFRGGQTVGQALSQYNQPLQRLLSPTGGGGAKGAAQLTADGIPRMPLGLTGTEPAQGMKFTQALLQPQVLSGTVQGGLSMLPDAKTAAMEAQTKLAQQQFDEEKRRFEQQRRDREAMARLLMPMYEDYMKQFGYSR